MEITLSTPFQNRLVGTIIVAAVLIIFLPDILDGKKKSYQAQFEQIPAQAQTFSTTITQTFPQEKLEKLPKTVIVNKTALDDQSSAGEATANGFKQSPVTAKSANHASQSATNSANNSASKVTPAKKPAVVAAAQQEKQASVVNKQTEQKTASKKLPEKSVAQQAWVIQLGSFRHKKNVEELISKLKKAGYTVFTRPIKTTNGVLTKVFIGPELIKSKLEKQLPALKKLTSVQGKLARFYPAN